MNNTVHRKKVKRTTIPIETKMAILYRLENGEGSTALGKEFNLSESTIRGIQKRASKITESNNCATNVSDKRASYSRNIVIENTEKALIVWIENSTQKGTPVNGELIKEKAKQYFNHLKELEPSNSSTHYKNLNFSASNGWLRGFLRRHVLHNAKARDEAASADETADKNDGTVVANNSFDDDGYCADEVFNVDETGLLWKKKTPSPTFNNAKSENTASGDAKERVALLCSNASGAKTLKPPPTIKKVLHPRPLKDAEDRQEESISMTADQIYAGIQLCSELENHFLRIDKNSERSLKFQDELRSCISGYRDVYKQLIKRQTSSQTLISSSDESDHEPVQHKNRRVLDSDE